MMNHHDDTDRLAYDDLLITLAEYASDETRRFSSQAHAIAALCLMDALACAAGALDDADCHRIIGPVVPGAILRGGPRVPFTALELDPVRAAFSTGTLIRWLDFSDTTFNGGHPSDNIGAILACADYLDRIEGCELKMSSVLDAMIVAYEIQGHIASAVKFDSPDVGLDAVLAVKLASSAAATRLLGGTFEQVANALSSAFVDGATLNAYRQPPNSGTRKGWAGPHASANGVEIALMARSGEMGYPRVLTAKPWGFFEVMLKGQPIELSAPLNSTIIEHVIFKLLPCQRNATTAAEAAMQLHARTHDRLDAIREIRVYTHAEALERIDNAGHLHNAAARDHSLQFIVASTLVHGKLDTRHYHEPLAVDTRVTKLVPRVRLLEDKTYSAGYTARDQRSTGNAIEVEFDDGSTSERVEVLYSAGHPARRSSLQPMLQAKFEACLKQVLAPAVIEQLLGLFLDHERLASMRVRDFITLLVPRRPLRGD